MRAGFGNIGNFLEHMIASLEHYDPFEGKLDFPEWSDDDDGET